MNKAVDAFRTISEVASELDIPQHVLRFWETRFSTIRPLKRGGGRRYYRPDDVELLRGIRHLLYGQGYTIKGVQRILKENGPRFVQAVGRGEQVAAPMPASAYEGPEDDDSADAEAAFAYAETDYAEPAPSRGYPAPQAHQPASAAPAAAPSAAMRRAMSDGALLLTPEDVDALRRALTELSDCAAALDALRQGAEPG